MCHGCLLLVVCVVWRMVNGHLWISITGVGAPIEDTIADYSHCLAKLEKHGSSGFVKVAETLVVQ